VTDFLKTFEALGGATARQLLLFAALIVPGFISLRMYEMRAGGEHRKANEVVVDVVVYSALTDLVALAVFVAIQRFVPASARMTAEVVLALPVFVVLPAFVGSVWFDVRRQLAGIGVLADPAAKSRSVLPSTDERDGYAVIVTLRTGRRIGGRIANSVDFRLEDDDVYLNEVWTLDEQCATFISKVPGTAGLYVRKAEYETIEFFKSESGMSQNPRGGME